LTAINRRNSEIDLHCIASLCDQETCKRLERWLEIAPLSDSAWKWQLIRPHSVAIHSTAINDCAAPIIDHLQRHSHLAHCRLDAGDVLEFRLLPVQNNSSLPSPSATHHQQQQQHPEQQSGVLYQTINDSIVRLLVRSVPPISATPVASFPDVCVVHSRQLHASRALTMLVMRSIQHGFYTASVLHRRLRMPLLLSTKLPIQLPPIDRACKLTCTLQTIEFTLFIHNDSMLGCVATHWCERAMHHSIDQY
jgi:hypothetical protein